MEQSKALRVASAVSRIVQILFGIVALACAAYNIHLFKGWSYLEPMNFAIFASITGMGVSMLLWVGPHYNTLLAERLPGIIDCILSGIYAIFFLAVGGSAASTRWCSWNLYWTSKTAPVTCGAWDMVAAAGFLAFAAYCVSTVLAGLDIKDGKGLVKPRGFRGEDPVQPITMV